MASTLPHDVLEQLTPLLGSLARLAADGLDPELDILVLGVGMDPEPEVLAELGRWLRLLISLRAQPSEGRRRSTVEALMLRGLAEAPVVLAVAAVAKGETGGAGARKLKATPERLDWTVQRAGELVSGDLDVDGGPGEAVAQGEGLRVAPERFGPGRTRLRVELRAPAGELFLGAVRLTGGGDTLEVPVIAQRAAAAPAVPGPKIGSVAVAHVVPSRGAPIVSIDGKGDFRTLAEAIAAAAPGATIRLGLGTHRLNRGLVLNKAVALVGEGSDRTEIVAEEADTSGVLKWVLGFAAVGTFGLRDLAVHWAGASGGDAVYVAQGEVAFQRCRFSGAKWVGNGIGAGLRIFGNVRGTVQECAACDNSGLGIVVMQQAVPTLIGNRCDGNGQSGINYYGTAGGAGRSNTCRGNATNGIYVSEQAGPLLQDNNCQGNKAYGIYIGEQARPTLEGNTCSENMQNGLGYWGDAAGTARRNVCFDNIVLGIGVNEQARPMLEGNICRTNKDSGIAYFGNAAGSSRENRCTGNEKCGLYVDATARPSLERNVCSGNKVQDVLDKRQQRRDS